MVGELKVAGLWRGVAGGVTMAEWLECVVALWKSGPDSFLEALVKQWGVAGLGAGDVKLCAADMKGGKVMRRSVFLKGVGGSRRGRVQG